MDLNGSNLFTTKLSTVDNNNNNNTTHTATTCDVRHSFRRWRGRFGTSHGVTHKLMQEPSVLMWPAGIVSGQVTSSLVITLSFDDL